MRPTNNLEYLFPHVAGVLYRQVDQVLQEQLGIGMSQCKILLLLEWSPGVQQRRLAEELGQTEASISRQVKLLQQKGLLHLRIDPQERRRHLSTLTPKGSKLTTAASEVLEQFYTPVFASLSTKSQQQLQEILIALHGYSCTLGKPMSCTHQLDIETVYDAQKSR